MKRFFILFFIPAMMTINGCSSVKNANLYSIDDDKKLGLQVSQQIAADPSTYPILDETRYPDAYNYLRSIVKKIMDGGKVKYQNDFTWKVSIVQNDEVLNAFCTPGGYIYVYTGIIKYLDSEDELAGVLGHEIAHADRRHSTKQMTKAQGTNILIAVASAAVGRDVSGVANPLAALTLLKYGRDDETEADLYSVRYLYPTEYDARGAARFFEKMEEAGNRGGPEFLSTHPNPGNRVDKIFAEWKKLGGKEGGTFDERYNSFKKMLP